MKKKKKIKMKMKKKKKEKKRKTFINDFSLEKLCDLGEGKEVIVTLDANNNSSKYFYHFVMAKGNSIIISSLYSYICQKQMIKRNYLQKKYSEYKNVARNNIYYYYNILYNRKLNNIFVSYINFCCSSEENNAVNEVGFEETEAENMNEDYDFEEAKAENMNEDHEFEEATQFVGHIYFR